MGLKTTKDYIAQNAVENIMAIPKKPAKKFVDTNAGDTQKLTPSGLEPVYVSKKVPPHCLFFSSESKQSTKIFEALISIELCVLGVRRGSNVSKE